MLHGMVFGSIFLLAFSGGLAGLYSYRAEWITAEFLVVLGLLGTFPPFFERFAR